MTTVLVQRIRLDSTVSDQADDIARDKLEMEKRRDGLRDDVEEALRRRDEINKRVLLMQADEVRLEDSEHALWSQLLATHPELMLALEQAGSEDAHLALDPRTGDTSVVVPEKCHNCGGRHPSGEERQILSPSLAELRRSQGSARPRRRRHERELN